ncbi:cell division inhibitor SulA [Shewanella salipaludis]|uniref:Cell division protein n=1 Tax=Shewanella salipaludis TaxID=2723052 RepID=A0A972G0Q2_9GAMM|nr:SulA-like leucine-rich domain-containing protein [Shewanella salipaludis]NMH65039.1 cell division protein [Shewanella salipaludis]
MKHLLGNAPRHPGLWLDLDSHVQDSQQRDITTMPTQTQGRAELQQLSAQLAQLSQQGRWIVLISPPNAIGYKQLLAKAGVRMDRVLLVHAKDEVEVLWAMERALTSGTSSAVISWTQSLDARDIRRLQLVAKSARAMGIVLEEVNVHLQGEALFDNHEAFQQHQLFGPIH